MSAPSAVEAILPLSPVQRGLLFHAAYDLHAVDIYVVQLVFRVSGVLDIARLRTAAGRLTATYRALRTEFVTVSDKTVQVVRKETSMPFDVHDLQHGQPDPEHTVRDWLERDRRERFDLRRCPLARIAVLVTGTNDYVVALTSHHLILDGWSLGIVANGLWTLYRRGDSSPLPLPPEHDVYSQYLRWLGAQDGKEDLRVWREALHGCAPTLIAPKAATAPAGLNDAVYGCVDPAIIKAVDALGRETGFTASTAAQVMWSLVLSIALDVDEVLFGAAVSGRPAAINGIETAVGLFVNTIPVRARIPWHARLATYCAGMQASQSELLPYHHVDLGAIAHAVGIPVLFDTLVVFHNQPLAWSHETSSALAAEGAQITAVEVGDGTHYPLTLIVSPAGGWTVRLLYRPDALPRAFVQSLLDLFITVCREFVAQPHLTVRELVSVTLRSARGAAAAPAVTRHAGAESVPSLFAAMLPQHLDATALISDDQYLSFAAVDQASDAVSRRLRDCGVGIEECVGVMLDADGLAPIAILGILKAGATYAPIDATWPRERIGDVCALLRITVVVTSTDRRDLLVNVSVVLDVTEVIGAGGASDAPRDIHPDGLAYVLCTSGTTGTSKAVAMTHRALTNLLQWHLTEIPTAQITLQLSAATFDAGIHEILAGWIGGGAVCVADRECRRDPGRLLSLIERHGIGKIIVLPYMWDAVCAEVQSGSGQGLASLSSVLVTGDVFEVSDVSAAMMGSDRFAQVENHYGPAETHVVTRHVVRKEEIGSARRVPIGAPIWNTDCRVLSRAMDRVPDEVVGELYVSGVAVARGYYGRPGITAARFVADPYASNGVRMYRTGDLVRTSKGELEFMGRSDHQVKLMGIRVDVSDVESAIKALFGVEDAAVVARRGTGERHLLIAHVACAAESALSATAIKEALGTRLPAHMVPEIVLSASLPRLPSGKVDRGALRKIPLPAANAGPSGEDATVEERAICDVATDVLGIAGITASTDLFSIGANSLDAMRMSNRLRLLLDTDVQVRLIYDARTPRGIARRLRTARRPRPPLTPERRGDRVCLSHAQRRLLFLDRLAKKSSQYNGVEGVRLRGPLQVEALARALTTIVERHESLRTHFGEAHGTPVQIIAPTAAVSLPVEDLTGLDEAAQQTRVQAVLREEWETPFDLQTGPVWRARLLRLGAAEHVLVRTLHHIVSDGWSQAVFNRELMTLYAAYRAGQANPLPPLPVQYADFVLWQQRWLEGGALATGLAYWTKQLAGVPERLELPTDRPRPAQQTFAAEVYATAVPAALVAQLRAVSQAHQATLYMTLLAAFGVVLARHSGQDDLVVGTPIANRQDAQLEDLIGFFVNTLALRLRVTPQQTFSELLTAVRRTTLEAYEHQDVPFERIVEALAPSRSLSILPVCHVVFALQNVPHHQLTVGETAVEYIHAPGVLARCDLEVYAVEVGSEMRFQWIYNSDLFCGDHIKGLADDFLRVLETTVGEVQSGHSAHVSR